MGDMRDIWDMSDMSDMSDMRDMSNMRNMWDMRDMSYGGYWPIINVNLQKYYWLTDWLTDISDFRDAIASKNNDLSLCEEINRFLF